MTLTPEIKEDWLKKTKGWNAYKCTDGSGLTLSEDVWTWIETQLTHTQADTLKRVREKVLIILDRPITFNAVVIDGKEYLPAKELSEFVSKNSEDILFLLNELEVKVEKL